MLKKSCIKLLLVFTFSIIIQFNTAYAFEYEGRYWAESEMGVSVNNNFPLVAYDALNKAGSTWNNAGSSFRFFYVGQTAATTSTTSPDGINVINHANSGLNGTLGFNQVWFYSSSGHIIDSDIEFNSAYSWSLTGQAGKFDFQSVATHEMGHSLQLGDLYGAADTEKTMYGLTAAGETKQRTLHQDDINGIRHIYP